MSQLIILPDSGSINFFKDPIIPAPPFINGVAKISVSGDNLNIDNNTSGQININGAFFVNGSGVSHVGHSHNTSAISGFSSAVSDLIPVKNIIAGSGISLTNSSGNFTIVASGNNSFDESNKLTKNPHGFISLTDCVINFDRTSLTFSIGPTGLQYDLYFQGNKISKSGTENIFIPINRPCYVYFNSSFQLEHKTSSFDYNNEIPLSCIYQAWGSDTVLFTDERYVANNNKYPIGYINSSIGLVYHSGLDITNYILNGDFNNSDNVSIALTNGIILDHDKTIIINNSNNNFYDVPYEQILYPKAYIPVINRRGISNLKINSNANGAASSDSPFKKIALILYNKKDELTSIWSEVQALPDNYVAYWICATRDTKKHIVSIMGQREDSSLSDALSLNIWQNLEIDNFLLENIKPLYRLIYQTKPYSMDKLVSILDLRSVNHNFSNNNHSSLYNLNNNDDHSQYMHIENPRNVNAIHILNSGIKINKIYPINDTASDMSIGSELNNIKIFNDETTFNINKNLSFNYHGDYDYGKISYNNLDIGTETMSIVGDSVSINRLNVSSTVDLNNTLVINGDNDIIIKCSNNYIFYTSGEEGTATLDNTDIGGVEGCRINNSTIGEYVPASGNFSHLTVNNTGVIIDDGTIVKTFSNQNIDGIKSFSTGIVFSSTSVAPPKVFFPTSKSSGTRLSFGGSSSAFQAEYAIGRENSALWLSTPDSSGSYKWYGGPNNIATLDGSGNFNIIGNNTVFGDSVTSGNNIVYGNINIGAKSLAGLEQFYLKADNSNSFYSNFKIINSDFISLIDIRNDGNIAIGNVNNLGMAYGGNRLSIRGSTSDATRAALLIQNSSGNALFSVSNNGNIGIGTSITASHKLQINNGNFVINSGIIQVNNSFNNDYNMIISSSGINITKTESIIAVDHIPLLSLSTVNFNSIINTELSSSSFFDIFGINLVANDTILIKDFSNSIYNGIYLYMNGTIDSNKRKIVRAFPLQDSSLIPNKSKIAVRSNNSIYILNSELSGLSRIGTSPLLFSLDTGENIISFDTSNNSIFQNAVIATAKYFKIDHPDPDSSYKHLQYGSLESPYNGIRLTGKGIVKDKICNVILPNYIKFLVHEEDINIQLTNKGHSKILYVDTIDLKNNKFTVKADKTESNDQFEFYWSFTGIRKDVPLLVPEQ